MNITAAQLFINGVKFEIEQADFEFTVAYIPNELISSKTFEETFTISVEMKVKGGRKARLKLKRWINKVIKELDNQK